MLSGNRNFEGRISPHVRANYLASPPLVVAYALAGSMNIDLTTDPLGNGADGKPVYLKDIWPSNEEIVGHGRQDLTAEMFKTRYADVFKGPPKWQQIETATGKTYQWVEGSTYVAHPPFFENMPKEPAPVSDIKRRRAAGDPRRLASRPTTSPRPARSRRTARPASTC